MEPPARVIHGPGHIEEAKVAHERELGKTGRIGESIDDAGVLEHLGEAGHWVVGGVKDRPSAGAIVDVVVESRVVAWSGAAKSRPSRAVGMVAIEPPDRGTRFKNEDLAFAGCNVSKARWRRREVVGQDSGRRSYGDGGCESMNGFRRMAVQKPIAGRGWQEAGLLEGEVGVRAGKPVEDAKRVDGGIEAWKDALHLRHEALGMELEERESHWNRRRCGRDIEVSFSDEIGQPALVEAQ